MSEEFVEPPLGSSTPANEKSRSRSSSVNISESESIALDNWCYDCEGLRLHSDTSDRTDGSRIALCSQCLSITSTVPSFGRPLYSLSEFDRTLTSYSSETGSSDLDSSGGDVFSEAVSQIYNFTDTLSTQLSSDSNEDIEHFELKFEVPDDISVCGSPDHSDSLPDSRPSTQCSVATVVRMAPTTKDKHLRTCRQSILVWEDDFALVNIDTLLPVQLQPTLDRLTAYIAGLQEVQVYFDENPTNEFGAAELAKVRELRQNAAQLKANVQQKLFTQQQADSDRDRAAANAAAAAAVAANTAATARTNAVAAAAAQVAQLTIAAVEPSLTSTMVQIKKAYSDMKKLPAKTPGEYKRLEAKCGEIDSDCKVTIDQFDGLKKEAVAAHDLAAAERFLDNAQELRDCMKTASQHVRKAAADLGFLPGQADAVTANLNLKAPVFSGAPSDAMDFYTFEKKLSDYFESIGAFSHHAMLIKLKAECLSEPASKAVKNHETYPGAIAELKRLYGQARILFVNKVKEIKKLGKCPDPVADVRVWAIEMKNQLVHIAELAEKHNVMHMFESSQVIDTIEGFFKTRDSYKFRDKLKEQMLLDPSFDIEDRKTRVKLLKEFLGQLIDDATFDLNYNMSRGHKAAENVISGDKAKDKASTKKAYSSLPSSNGCENCCTNSKSNENSDKQTSSFNTNIQTNKSKVAKGVMCKICEVEHTHISYCEAYQRALPPDRFRMVCAVKACPRCLRMDSAFAYDQRKAWYNAHLPYCTNEHLCSTDECAQRPGHFRNNVTLCPKHTDVTHQEQDLYMQSLDANLVTDGAKFYLNMHGVYNTAPTRPKAPEPPAEEGVLTIVEPDISEPAVYMLQMIPGPKNERLLVFYDSGCYMAALSDRAYQAFDTTTVRPGPTVLEAAANSTVHLKHGDEQFLMPLQSENGVRRFATITGLRMPKITSQFPVWPLADAWQEIQRSYAASNDSSESLPTVEESIGGAGADLLIGIQYQKYFPVLKYTLPGGLSIYSAQFAGCDGHQGVLGGPSGLWRDISQNAHFMGPSAYLISEIRAYRSHCLSLKTLMSVDHDIVDECDLKRDFERDCCDRRIMATGAPNKFIKEMLSLDEIGSEIDYRCEKCRACYDCKDAERVELISLQEEAEQFLIEQSVSYDEERKVTVAKLPFVETVTIKLTDNYFTAKKILEGQVRQAQKRIDAVSQIEASHNKLRDKGYVVPLSELPPDLRAAADKPGYYIPWRTVQSDSLSTPTRMVFDASSKTGSGYSLNCLLAKGRNMLADMLILLHKFRFGAAAFTADVSMAYNGVLLDKNHLRYHKYLWIDGLAVGGAIVIMVVLTLIYGVRPAGNLTMRAFQLTAEIAEKNPVLKASGGPACLKNNSYMDDILAAFFNNRIRDTTAGGLEKTLDVSQLKVKAITKNGEIPCDKVSADQKTVNVVGYVWEPARDVLRLDIKPLFLGKKVRGRRPPAVTGDVKDALRQKFTRRELAGKIAAIYDPLGICVPVTAKMKLSLREVVRMTADWDELLPEEKLDEWVTILAEIQELAAVEVKRSLLTEDCDENTRYELITCTDASEVIAAACVYLRVLRDGGEVLCGLLTAKSKLTSKLTIPRAELKACVIGVCITEVVKKALGSLVKSNIFVTDSVVALTWINTDQRPLQVGVRNAVIQIRRFSSPSQWFHVSSNDNPADIGTRGPRVADIMADSVWQKGYNWMAGESKDMPIRKLCDIDLTKDDRVAVNQEVRNSGLQSVVLNMMTDKIGERYAASCYIVDPCSLPWRKFVRKITLIIRVVRVFAAKTKEEKQRLKFAVVGGKIAVNLNDDDEKYAEKYIFSTAAKEVKKFNDLKKLSNVVERDEMLVYSGRLLDGVGPVDPLNIMNDINTKTFLKPVVDRWSPLAYSIMVHAHVTMSHHGGAVSSLRAAESIAYILHGKSLAVEVRKDCAFCRRYKAKCETAVIGKLPVERVTVAPAFYNTQVDLFGPMDSHCKHGRRAVVKVYGVIFKCMTTLAVAVFVMDAYDTPAFLDAFYRFGTRHGYPAKVFIDAGSQLLAAFNGGVFSVVDVTKTLNGVLKIQIEYQVCPVNAHEAHGLVERAIREVKKILAAVFHGVKMDILRLETVFAWVANELNSLPLCLGNQYRDLEHLDLITPNRLMLGRNNRRSPAEARVDCHPQNILRQVEDVERGWWTVWLKERLGELVPAPTKWRDGEPLVKIGDVVVFVKEQNDIAGVTWRVGIVDEVETGADNVIRRVTIKYRVVRSDGTVEADYRRTRRSVRQVAVLVSEDELDLAGELSVAQKEASVKLCWRGDGWRGPGELHMGPGSG